MHEFGQERDREYLPESEFHHARHQHEHHRRPDRHHRRPDRHHRRPDRHHRRPDRHHHRHPHPHPAAGSPAANGETGTNLLWLWILLGALVLVGLIVLIVRSAGRRSATAAGWQSRIIDAYAKGSALHDAMSVAETPGALAAGDAGARWADIQRRSDDLAQTLYALRESAPDEENSARAADALASLQAVRSAMDAERAPGGAGAEYAEVVRSRLRTFEASLRALRGLEQPPL